VRITSKGQVTIPQDIRERLGLLPYSEVEFELEGDSVRLRKARRTNTRGAALIARARGRATTRLSTDEILALTRE
jgi:AbrB family looped-hinge helix DNA binding protein